MTASRGRKSIRPEETGKRNGSSIFPHRILPFSSESTWRHVWMLYAAGILFFARSVSSLTASACVEELTSPKAAQPTQPSRRRLPPSASLEEQLSDAGHDHAVANAEIAQRDKMIADLRRQLERQSAEINEMKAAQDQLESNLRAGDASRQDLSQQQTELAQKLESAQNNSNSLEQKLDSLAQQSTQDAARAKASEAKVNDLTRLNFRSSKLLSNSTMNS